MAFKTTAQVAQDKVDRGYISGRYYDYFNPPHGGHPPSAEAVSAQTLRYCRTERSAMLARPLLGADAIRFNEFEIRMAERYGLGWHSPGGNPAPPERGGSGSRR